MSKTKYMVICFQITTNNSYNDWINNKIASKFSLKYTKILLLPFYICNDEVVSK